MNNNTIKSGLCILVVILSFFFGLVMGSENQPDQKLAESLQDCRNLAMNQALEDAYVDHVLDSIASARADSIVYERMKLSYPQ